MTLFFLLATLRLFTPASRREEGALQPRVDIVEPFGMSHPAHHLSAGADALPTSAMHSLHALWNRVAGPVADTIPREELRGVARTVSAAARSLDMQPERLLILVKESWAAHPELDSREDRQAVQRILTEVVSLCICEFFRSSPASE